MKKASLLLALALAFSTADAQPTREDLLVTPAWLATHLSDANLVLLHVGIMDEGKHDYGKAHIAGARYVDLGDVSVSSMNHTDSLMLEMPSAEKLRSHLDVYHNAWKKAGHPGRGKVFLAFHMFVDPDSSRARRIAGAEVESYFKSIVEATAGMDTVKSKDYAGYEKQREQFAKFNIDTLIEGCAAWVGSPDQVASQITRYHEACGGFDFASMQVNFHMLPAGEALRSIELFAREVMPRFRTAPVPA